MTDEERLIYRLSSDFPFYSENLLKITPKSGSLIPFRLNYSQKFVHNKLEEQLRSKGMVRAIIVKARQQGFSTYIGGRFFWKSTLNTDLKVFILTHLKDATDNLFAMVQNYYDNLPVDLRPLAGASNAKELYFPNLRSGYKVGTAGSRAVGRSATFQLFHGSEVAYWPDAEGHMAGAVQAVPDALGTEIILESTGNGMNNEFYRLAMDARRGKNDYEVIFVPWFWSNEYRRSIPQDEEFYLDDEEEDLKRLYHLDNEQIYWRRKKRSSIGEAKFAREYPANIDEAFRYSGDDLFIDSQLVMKARARVSEGFGPLVLGVDPAAEGKDSTALVWRKGGKVLDVQRHQCSTMECVGMVVNAIREGVEMVFIDTIGVGIGVYDRLLELGYGYKVRKVVASGKPSEQMKYFNKRAECWGRMKEWLAESGDIPDNDILHTDLTTLGYKYHSNGTLQLESKQQLKEKGFDSPDTADALSLTFSEFIADQSLKVAKSYRAKGIDYHSIF